MSTFTLRFARLGRTPVCSSTTSPAIDGMTDFSASPSVLIFIGYSMSAAVLDMLASESAWRRLPTAGA